MLGNFIALKKKKKKKQSNHLVSEEDHLATKAPRDSCVSVNVPSPPPAPAARPSLGRAVQQKGQNFVPVSRGFCLHGGDLLMPDSR